MAHDVDALVDEATERGQLRRRVKELDRENRRLEDALGETERILGISEAVGEAELAPPKWSTRKSKTKHPATPCMLLTDTHFDEVVRPEEVLGLNAYSREIAYQRLERAFKGVSKVARNYIAGHEYDGFLLMLGGDIFTGDIHADLTETNETPVIESLVYWLEPLIAGINMLVEEFGKVHIAAVTGNHGRNTKKPRAKRRAFHNYDYLVYRLVQREFRNDDRVTVQVPQAADCLVPIYDTTILLTHGDQFKGGSGISAALSPLMLGEHRKTKRHASAARAGEEDMSYDLMVMGHWHTRYILPRVMVGGSTKGIDEYTFSRNMEYQPPSQEFFIVAPDRGVILNAPVWVQNREEEGW